MTGTLLNAAGILVGGVVGLTARKAISPSTQQVLKVGLGALTVFVGLRLSWVSLGGGYSPVLKQLVILVLALTLGRFAGRLLRLQKFSNRLGQFAKDRIASASADQGRRFSDGFVTCALLFCVGPLAILGALQDGLNGQWQTLAIKAVMDGLATMAFVSMFGWSAMLSVVPVVAYQGTLTLAAKLLEPFLEQHALLNSFNITSGLLIFSVALVILELKRVELADYLPSLAFAPLITWMWK